MDRSIRQFTGCLLGHALGDALGAPVEFMRRAEILRAFGPDGVRGLEPWDGRPAGTYTDDTQMMRATAEGLLEYAARSDDGSAFADVTEPVWRRYRAWYESQSDPVEARRPGATCLSALAGDAPGDMYDPINDSKGAGGIMRVSPVGLMFEPGTSFEVGAELAALTHGHPSGHLAAGAFADLISRVVRARDLPTAVGEVREILLGWEDDGAETIEALDEAVELYISDVHPVEAVPRLGEGWIAEEALAIVVHCALSYPEDWVEGTLAAVNMTGDSDTTGCLAGALLGALLGEDALPLGWVSALEDGAGVREVAERIWSVTPRQA